MPVETKLTCAGCSAHISTPAFRPEKWPSGWQVFDDGVVYHSEACHLDKKKRKVARSDLKSALLDLNIKPSDLKDTALAVRGSPNENAASKALADMVMRLFEEEVPRG